MCRKFDVSELKDFFKTYGEIERRIKEIAPLSSREDIMGFSYDDDGDVRVNVYSSDCGNDTYYFPLEYLTLDNEEIEKREREKAELARKIREQEELKEKRELEKKERREYERLRKKYEGS